jgi:hypothetical protein
MESYFNTHSKIHYRDSAQIKNWWDVFHLILNGSYQITDNLHCRWTALHTATLKFSLIYNTIKQNPPRGSSPDDWMATAHTVCANQTRGNAFTLVLAWKRVCNKQKWIPDWDDLTTIIPSDLNTPVPSSDQTDNGHPPSTSTIISVCTPSS